MSVLQSSAPVLFPAVLLSAGSTDLLPFEIDFFITFFSSLFCFFVIAGRRCVSCSILKLLFT